MSDWGITTKVPADVVLAEGIALCGRPAPATRATTYPPGPETPLEMLNRSDAFFALTIDGRWRDVRARRRRWWWSSCRDRPRCSDPDRASAARHVELEVVLHGGAEYRGRADLRAATRRAAARLDYLNGAGAFFALWQRRRDLVHQQVACPARSVPSTETAVARLDRLIK